MQNRQDIWLILLCRSTIPPWLMPFYVREGFIVITEEDLRLGEKEISAYKKEQGVSATGEELRFVCENRQANVYTVRHTVLKMQEEKHPGPEPAEEIGSTHPPNGGDRKSGDALSGISEKAACQSAGFLRRGIWESYRGELLYAKTA